MVTLDEAKIRALLADPGHRAALPGLAAALAPAPTLPRPGGCKPCQQRKMRSVAGEGLRLKQAAAALPASQKLYLKQALKADRLRIVLPGVGGRGTTVEF